MPIEVFKRTIIPPFSHAKVTVSVTKSSLIKIERLRDEHDELRVSNYIVEVCLNELFWMFMTNSA